MVETAAESWLGDSAAFARLTVDGVGAAEAGAAVVAKREQISYMSAQMSLHLQTLLLLPIVPRNLWLLFQRRLLPCTVTVVTY